MRPSASLPQHQYPAGRFYAYRGFEDDVSEGRGYPEAMTTLDFGMAIWRVAEAIAVPMAFARVGVPPGGGDRVLRLALVGPPRTPPLLVDENPARYVPVHQESRQDVVQPPPVAVPLDAPTSALGHYVREATSGLFAAFGGFEPGPGVTEGIADDLLARGRRTS